MVASDRNGRLGGETIRDDQVRGPGMVDIYDKDDRGGLWKVINQFVTDPE